MMSLWCHEISNKSSLSLVLCEARLGCEALFCQVLVQVVECFGAAITKKKPHFLPENSQKKPFFGFKQCFWGLTGQL